MASSAIRIALGFAEIRDSELFLAAGCKSMEDFSSKFLRYGSNETNSILDVYSLVVSNEQNYEFLASASLNNLIRLADSLKVKEAKYIGCGLVITPDGKRREYKEFMQEVESNEEEVKRITEEKEELERKLLDSEGNIETLQRQNYEMRNKVEEFIQNSSTSGNAIKILDHGQNMINAAVKRSLAFPKWKDRKIWFRRLSSFFQRWILHIKKYPINTIYKLQLMAFPLEDQSETYKSRPQSLQPIRK